MDFMKYHTQKYLMTENYRNDLLMAELFSSLLFMKKLVNIWDVGVLNWLAGNSKPNHYRAFGMYVGNTAVMLSRGTVLNSLYWSMVSLWPLWLVWTTCIPFDPCPSKTVAGSSPQTGSIWWHCSTRFAHTPVDFY